MAVVKSENYTNETSFPFPFRFRVNNTRIGKCCRNEVCNAESEKRKNVVKNFSEIFSRHDIYKMSYGYQSISFKAQIFTNVASVSSYGLMLCRHVIHKFLGYVKFTATLITMIRPHALSPSLFFQN